MSDNNNSDKEVKELKKQLKPLLDVNPEAYDIILEKFRVKNAEIFVEKENGELLKKRNEELSAEFDVWKDDCTKIKEEMSHLQKLFDQAGGLEEVYKKCKQELKKILSELQMAREANSNLKEQLRKVWEDKLNLVQSKNDMEEKLKMLVRQNQKMEEMLKKIIKQENTLVIERNKKFDEIAGKGNKSKKINVSLQQFLSTMMPEWEQDVEGFMEKKLPDLKKKYDQVLANKEKLAETGRKTTVTVKGGQKKGIVKAIQQAADELANMDSRMLKQTFQELFESASQNGSDHLCHHHREERLAELEKRVVELVAVAKEQSELIARNEKKFMEAREEVERFQRDSQTIHNTKLAESEKQILKMLAITKEQSELIARKDRKFKEASGQVDRLKTCLLNVSYQMAKKLSEVWITKDSLKKKQALLQVMKQEMEDQTMELNRIKGILRTKDVELMISRKSMSQNTNDIAQRALTDLKAILLEIKLAMENSGNEKSQANEEVYSS